MGHIFDNVRRLFFHQQRQERCIVLTGLCAGFLSLHLSVAWANIPPSTELPQGVLKPLLHSGEARAPYGWVDFCDKLAHECVVRTDQAETIRLTPENWRALTEVNERINRQVEPVTDQDQWGKLESWDLPATGKGDCEDYVLLKRQELAAKGFSRRALLVTVVVDENDEGHAVLMVRTDRGDFILDNKRNPILAWHDTGYVFVKRERQDRLGWTSLGGVASLEQVASR